VPPEEVPMLAEERALREELDELAATPRGRQLLQLALRGIEADDRALVCGRWERRGEAGCLFQHAYWQGVREGAFEDGHPARDWVSAFVGPGDYWNVIRTIAAFDALGREGYSEREPRRVLGTRRVLRQGAWRDAVTGLLVDALRGDGVAVSRERSALR
jgi:hypothetical protein